MSMLGKRKRRAEPTNKHQITTDDSDDDAAARVLFQRAFEAKFKPLEQKLKPAPATLPEDVDGSDSDESDDWSGVSEEIENKIEIIQVQDAINHDDSGTRSRELKAFMSSKIPSSAAKVQVNAKAAEKEEDDTDAANLKNDLALQRLLKESHLLDASAYSTTGSEVQGKKRLKALDLRIQDLGGKGSHLEQAKMPLAHRVGIVAKSTNREQKRRKNAAENGIVLERAKFEKKSTRSRDTGLGGPTVGKFKGGMLRLNSKDLRGIEGFKTSGRGGRRRGRGG